MWWKWGAKAKARAKEQAILDADQCPHTVNCSIYRMIKSKPELRNWRVKFCEHEQKFVMCARYKKIENGERVPLTLLPNGTHIGKGGTLA